MNRNHLALFQAVAQAGSISGGAAAVRVSQPAVSRQISELEDALGVRLLDRLPRGCRLTEAGSILADYAQRWCSLESAAAQAIEEYRGLKRGRLKVGASLTIGAYLLPRVLADYHRRFPSVELKVEIANTEHIQRSLTEGSIEVGLTEGPVQADGLKAEVFFQDELVPIAPANHRLLNLRRVSVRDFLKEPLILREEGSGTRAVVERALRRQGVKIEPLLSMASPEAIKNAVAAGMGVAIVSRLVIEWELKAGSLAVIPVTGLKIERPFHLQQNLGRSQSPALSRFLDSLDSMSRSRGERR